MAREREWFVSCCVLVGLASTPGAPAQELSVGFEFQVNTFTADYQGVTDVGADADGDFVVVWQSNTQDDSNYGLFARRFSSAGAPLGGEFQVNTITEFQQLNASLAVAPNGSFVVAWDSYDPQDPGIRAFARRFSSAGVPQASEFRLSAFAATQRYPAVAADNDGDFVIAWQSYEQDFSNWGVFARRFSSAGSALAVEFQVNTFTSLDQRYPAVAVDADGDFVVAWGSFGQDGFNTGVFAQRFSSAGAPLATEFQVNSFTGGYESRPSATIDADGDFVVAWMSSYPDFALPLGIAAQRFSSTGAPLGAEFQVNTYTPGSQIEPTVRSADNGDFVVSWHSNDQDGSMYGVFAQRFSSGGAELGSEFQVNTYTTSNQIDQAVGIDAKGDFVIAWASETQDGAGSGIFAQRFALPIGFDIDGNGVADALSDGLLALRYLFGFRGTVLVGGAVAAGCTRCDAPSIETYFAGLALEQLDQAGSELQVNTFTDNGQREPAIAARPNGDFVVAWFSPQDGSFYGVFARRFSSVGSPLAAEFQVNTYTDGDQRYPAVGLDSDGDFLVAWSSNGQDGSQTGVFAQAFSSTGAALAAEFQINAFTTDNQHYPAVARRANGEFVVTWQSQGGQDGSTLGVFARLLSSTGAPVGAEFQVSTYTFAQQRLPAVGSAPNGDFVVAWGSAAQDNPGGDYGVFGRRFSSAGAPLTGEFLINAYTVNAQERPTIGMDGSGGFVVAWASTGQDGANDGIFARRFSSAGAPITAELQVNAYTLGGQFQPSVASSADGGFVVAWESDDEDGYGYGAFARRFSSAGAALGGTIQISNQTSGNEYRPAVAASGSGFVIALQEDASRDGSGAGIFARRYANAFLLDVDGNGATDPLTDGLLLLRYLFGFRGATLTNGAVGAGCTRCDAASIEPYLAAHTG